MLNKYHVDGYLNHAGSLPDGSGSEWFSGASQHAWQCAEALKQNRATLAGLRWTCHFRKAAG